MLAAVCVASVSIRGADPDLSSLRHGVDRLEALTQRVEAISAIKRLQHAYGHYSELGLWHDFADLFADTGIGYYTQGALDREGIRSLFLKEVGGGRLGLADGRIYPHISMQPVVTLAADGRSGKGRWHIMAMLGGYERSASWSGGVYENQYVLENGVWKIKEVRYFPEYSGRYDDPGWTPTRQPTPFHFDASRVGKPILDVPEPALRVDGPQRRRSPRWHSAWRVLPRVPSVSATRSRSRISSTPPATTSIARCGTTSRTCSSRTARWRWGCRVSMPGATSIRRGLNAAFGPAGIVEGEINDHVHLQTIVTVSPDGRTARARGTDIGMTGTTDKQALWSQSIYENEFVKQDGVWKFKAMHVYPRFIVDAEKGWAKDAQPAPGPRREFPPDRPPTETYEIYPRFHIAPLHFDHPVTGRPPQYPEGTRHRARPGPVRSVRLQADLLAQRDDERRAGVSARVNGAIDRTQQGLSRSGEPGHRLRLLHRPVRVGRDRRHLLARRLEGAVVRRQLRRPRADPSVAEAALPERQVARLPHGPPGRTAGHSRIGGRAEREDSRAAVSNGRSSGRRRILDLRRSTRTRR